jgi:type III pantothenate kinase
MMLLVDIGNTRVKWAMETGGRLSPQRAASHMSWAVDDWEREIFGEATGVERVAAVSVAGEGSRQALTEAAGRRGVSDVRFFASSAAECGIRNAYPDPKLLGVDRWAAVVGGFHLVGARACCVVDIGTATTIDAVDDSGQHLGGFIVPGPQLMVSSLLSGTSDLAAHTAASTVNASGLFADNTRDAIERGCRVTLAALIDRTHAELGRVARGMPALLLTGGAAAEVVPYVLARVEFVPDLVLHGVARLARAGLEPA